MASRITRQAPQLGSDGGRAQIEANKIKLMKMHNRDKCLFFASLYFVICDEMLLRLAAPKGSCKPQCALHPTSPQQEANNATQAKP